ncbi:hypothetical protein N7541_008125 [Penicillium brevicompactum]|uniref:DUF7600 domain-containing protein n=1 Tax=Penicillium brevicompactum TaxID=5074 RepID=A0A9W9R427_PENBR|nr:hypothetical protein N7541_008125 [Penicillium brevicompactum]
MEVDIYGCIICGCPVSIAFVESGWWSEFRIIYSTLKADPLKRWDDDDRVPELDATIPDMDQPQHERVHKFLVHESCWKLLCRFFDPQNVPLDRLVAICESLALTEESGNVSWDHSYNDLYETWNKWAPWYQVSEAPSIDISEVTLKAHQSQWATVTGLIETDEVRDECRIHKRNLALVPPDVVQIGTSLVNAGETGFITGISFMSAKGDIVRLGYRSKGNESFVKVSRLTGFLLAMAPKGLKGLKIMDKGIASQWIGFPLDTPVTERLATFQSIEAVEVGVDVSHVAPVSETLLKRCLTQN